MEFVVESEGPEISEDGTPKIIRTVFVGAVDCLVNAQSVLEYDADGRISHHASSYRSAVVRPHSKKGTCAISGLAIYEEVPDTEDAPRLLISCDDLLQPVMLVKRNPRVPSKKELELRLRGGYVDWNAAAQGPKAQEFLLLHPRRPEKFVR